MEPFVTSYAKDSSCAWEFKKENFLEVEVDALLAAFQHSFVAIFQATTTDGSLRDYYIVQTTSNKLVPQKNFTFEGINFMWAPCCSFCMKGAPHIAPHKHTLCPLILVMDKHQNQIRLQGYKVEDLGQVVADNSLVKVDFGKEIHSLNNHFAKLETKVRQIKCSLPPTRTKKLTDTKPKPLVKKKTQVLVKSGTTVMPKGMGGG